MKRLALATVAAAFTLTASATPWMTSIADNTPVRQMSLPGAHDAATASASSAGQTQSKSIPELWEAGVRAFDFRPAYKSGSLQIYHGITNTNVSMEQALNYLKEKLAADPQDFAVILMRNETKDTSLIGGKDDYDNWNAAMQALLQNYNDAIVAFNPNLTLGDVRGKIVILSRDAVSDSRVAHADNWGDNQLDKEGLIRYNGGTATLWLQDGYNTGGTDKTNAITALLSKAAKAHKGTAWVINHCSGTKSSVSANAKTQNKAALDFLNDASQQQGRTGMVFMDYAGDNSSSYYGADLVQAIIDRNFIEIASNRTGNLMGDALTGYGNNVAPGDPWVAYNTSNKTTGGGNGWQLRNAAGALNGSGDAAQLFLRWNDNNSPWIYAYKVSLKEGYYYNFSMKCATNDNKDNTLGIGIVQDLANAKSNPEEVYSMSLNNLKNTDINNYGIFDCMFTPEHTGDYYVFFTSSTLNGNVIIRTSDFKLTEGNLYDASKETPVNMTGLIQNASFDEGFAHWTNNGMATQNNASFPLKNGYYYCEKWTASGGGQNHLTGSAGVSQSITLPRGKYTLSAAAQNIRQDATETIEPAGAYIYAGSNNNEVLVGDANTYTIDFQVPVDGAIEIGYRLQDPSGNYVTVDNFQLFYTGEADPVEEYVAPAVSIDGDEIEPSDEYLTVENSTVTLRTNLPADIMTLQYYLPAYYNGPAEWVDYTEAIELPAGHNVLKVRGLFYNIAQEEQVYKIYVPTAPAVSNPPYTYVTDDTVEVDGVTYVVTGENAFTNGDFSDGYYGWYTGSNKEMGNVGGFTLTEGPAGRALTGSTGGGQASDGAIFTRRKLEPGKYLFSLFHKNQNKEYSRISLGSETTANNATGADGENILVILPEMADWTEYKSIVTVTAEQPYMIFSFRWLNGATGLANINIVPIAIDNAAAKSAYEAKYNEALAALETAGVNPGQYSQAAADEAKAGLEAINATVNDESDGAAFETAMEQIATLMANCNTEGRNPVDAKRAITIKHVGSGSFVGNVGGKFAGNGEVETVFFTVPSATEGAFNLVTDENSYLYVDGWNSNMGTPGNDDSARFRFEQVGNGYFYICNAFNANRLASDNNDANMAIYGDKSQSIADTDNRGIYEITYADVAYPVHINVVEGDLLPTALDGFCGKVPSIWTGVKRDGSDTNMSGTGTLRNIHGSAIGIPATWLVRWDGDHDVYYTTEMNLEPGVYALDINAKYWSNHDGNQKAEVNSRGLRFTLADSKGYDYNMSQSFIKDYYAGDYEAFNCKFNVTEAGTYYLSITGCHAIFGINELTFTKVGEAVSVPAVEFAADAAEESDMMEVDGVHFGPVVFTFGSESAESVFVPEDDNTAYAYGNDIEFTPDFGSKGTLYAYNVVDGIHGAVASKAIDVREYPEIKDDHIQLGEGLEWTEDGHILISHESGKFEGTISLTFQHEGYDMYYKFIEVENQEVPGTAPASIRARESRANVNLDEYTKVEKGETITSSTAGQLELAAAHNGTVLATRSAAVGFTTGVSSIFADGMDAEVYTLDGIRVKNATDLKPGIYVVRSGAATRKVVVK